MKNDYIKSKLYDFSCYIYKIKKMIFKQKNNKNLFSKQKKVNLIFIWSVLAVSIIQILIFWVYVNFDSLLLAFKTTRDGTAFTLDNFKYIFTEIKNPFSEIKLAFINTLKFFFFGLFVGFPLTYLTSYFLYKKIAGYKFFRFVFYLPAIISAVVLTSFFKYMLAPKGPIFDIFKILFNKEIIFLANSDYALKVLLFYNIWSGLGAGTIFYVASFSRIPLDVLESAKLEGVNNWQEIRYFIFPMTFPFVSTMIFISFTTMLSATGPILLFTQGACNTMTIDYWMYVNTIEATTLNRAAAFGLFLTCINLPVAIIFRKIANKVETVEF